MSERILDYFPSLTNDQREKLLQLKEIYARWNSMINVISRKDMDNFMVHHVLHSLAISKVIQFAPGTSVLDVGTGGGFPGIPLAIRFPDTGFTLLDSTGKKIKVVESVASELKLGNVTAVNKRAEDEKGRYHFIISRAVTAFPAFVRLTSKNVAKNGINSLPNGILALKGGDLEDELRPFRQKAEVWEISDFFKEQYFETKKIVYLPV